MKVVKIGGQPYHVDNDSAIFSATKKQFESLNLPIGISSGKLKEEIPGAKFKSFQGNKNLNLSLLFD